MKRTQLIAGIVLICLGAFVVFQGVSYSSHRSVMRMGDFHASVDEQRAIPTWAGGLAIVGGVLLVGASLWRRGA
jgi:drug/metabolite transporter (DMT)-like permease